jgi:UDP-N-acetylmuramoyl-L-alanyl-D-glutamate--2,6-diaminopimelate ligase
VDGHEYCAYAIARGAGVLVVEDDGRWSPRSGLTVLRADDTRLILAELLRVWHGVPDRRLRMIAVTGTNGKTSVCHFVRDLIEADGSPCGLLGTIRIETGRRDEAAALTTPGPDELFGWLVEMVGAGRIACAMEASSHALDQDRLGRAEIDVAAFTNVGRDHLDYHPDLEHYVRSKRRLLGLLNQPEREKPPGRAVVYGDDPTWARSEWPRDAIFVGRSETSDVRIRKIGVGRNSTLLQIDLRGESLELRSPVLGRYNGENLALTVGIAHASGMTADRICEHAARLRPVPGRLEPVGLPDGPLCLVDYAHTPDGLRAALEASRELGAGRLHLVFGCGGDRDRGKRPLMSEVAVELADRVFLTLDNPRNEDPARIFADAQRGFRRAPERAVTIPDRAEALAEALAECRPEDVLLVAGKGHETYQIIGNERLNWDDREALRQAWAYAGRGGA